MLEPTLWVAFIAGLVSFLSPCFLPLVPAYVSYMSGHMTHTMGSTLAAGASGAAVLRPTLAMRLNTFLHSLAFVGGFAFVFIVIGLLGTVFVQQIGRQNITLVTEIISRLGGVVIIVFGLHFMGALATGLRWLTARQNVIGNPLFSIACAVALGAIILWGFVDILIGLPVLAVTLIWLFVGGAFSSPATFWQRTIDGVLTALYSDTRRQFAADGRRGLGGSALMGVVFSAGWTPCIGPIYGAILTLAVTGQNVGQAGALLTAYSLGLGVPFLLAALLLDGAQGIVRKLQKHVRTIERFAGIMLVVVGVLVASGRLQELSQNFAVQFADLSYRLEECAVQVTQGQIGLGDFFACAGEEAAALDDVPAA